MLLLALIGFVWVSCCVMAVALCIAARRADEDLAVVLLTSTDAEPTPEPTSDFVATFAEPQAEPVPAPRPVRSAQHQTV